MNQTAKALLIALPALTAAFTAPLVMAQPAPASAARAPAAKPPFPRLTLPDRKSQGLRAVELLGDRLPEVAAWYGKSSDELRLLLLRDKRLKVDQRGRLFFEEEIDRPLPITPESAASTGALNGQLAPLGDTFLLHSRPGAQRTIYLNFKGAVITNSAWNSGTINAQPFDLDGFPGTFSQTELERIQYIWQRVAEDYAPFDVNVTTEAQPADALTRSGSTDQVFGTTVLITHRNGVYSCSCGGVAYLGIFDDTSDFYKPALVFYDALGGGNEKFVAEAISHEAGHNMGLGHDGFSGGGYYEGHGSGVTGWAPIMGVGYQRALVQWSKGEYATATNVQDDYTVMQGNGLPLRTDDHGNTPATATPLPVNAGALAVTGVIERPGDVDVFSFASGAGLMSFTLTPAVRSANLDAQVDLRDGTGALLASINPAEALNATLSYTAANAGTFYLSVRGVGKGDPLTTGYTAYGSVGQYALSASVPAGASQPPVAALAAAPTSGTVPLTVSFSSAGSSDPDGSIAAIEWNFGDGSPPATGATASHVYGTAGTYTALLKLTDNTGLTTARSVVITAQAPVVVTPMRVSNIAMAVATVGKTGARATAGVTVLNAGGAAVAGATVTGTWSGLVSGTVTGVTGANGTVTLTSPNSKRRGTFVFTVTGVTLAGFSYQSGSNTETSDSVTW